MEQINITKDQIEIRAPFYHKLVLVIKTLLFYFTMGFFCICIIILLSDLGEKIAIIGVFAICLYLPVLMFYIWSKVYLKYTKTTVTVNRDAISLCKRSGKKKIIKTEDIEKIVLLAHSSYMLFFDELTVYSKSKQKVRFNISESLIETIELLTGKKVQISGNRNSTQ